MTCDNVDLPEPFGPMIACTSPLFTVSDSPWRISRSSTRTCKSLTSSNGISSSLTQSNGSKAEMATNREAAIDHLRQMQIQHRRHQQRSCSEADQELLRQKVQAVSVTV